MFQEMITAYDCMAIIAAICLNGPANVELVRGWPWSGAKISLGDVIITSTISMDNRSVPDSSKMQEICFSDKCFIYSRRCSVLMEEMHCKYYYASDTHPYLREIEMIGPSMAEIEKSWSNISFAPSFGIHVGFDRLTFDNGIDVPPIDRSRGRP